MGVTSHFFYGAKSLHYNLLNSTFNEARGQTAKVMGHGTWVPHTPAASYITLHFAFRGQRPEVHTYS